MTESGRVGYVLNAFPVVSETFILNELRAVEQSGIRVVVFALGKAPRGPVHEAVAKLRGPVVRAPETKLAAAKVHLRALLRDPRGGLGRIVRLLRRVAATPTGERRAALRRRLERLHAAVWVGDAAQRLQVDHLHAHYAKAPLEVAAAVHESQGLPYSFAAHAKDLYTAPRERLARRLASARFAITCHREGQRYLEGIAAPEDAHKVLHVAHGIDTKLFRPRADGTRPGRLLAIGRLTPKKGFDELVRACALLRAEGRSFRCDIVGEGRLRRALERQIRAAGLEDRVRIRPFRRQEELPREYRRAAVLVAPAVQTPDGNRDGLSNVVLEALACGVPVVASRVGGIPEAVVHERTGLLVDPGDAGALAEALGRLLDDPGQAERLGRAGAAALEKLDFRQTVTPLIERFRACARPPLETLVREVSERAWQPGKTAARAAKRLGTTPHRDDRLEEAIRRRTLPGLRASPWREDLRRVAKRRLWDELYKVRRAEDIEAALGGALPRGRVLDLGTGRGGLSVALQARGVMGVGVDLRRRNCALTRLRGQRYGFTPDTSVARGEELPFADGTFALVCCIEVLEHVRDPRALLREIHRVLAPGGACVLTVVNRFAHRDPHYHLVGVNYLPRPLGSAYVRWRGRDKASAGDLQGLDEMHYFRFGAFEEMARELGFAVHDPERPVRPVPRAAHALKRRTSLGFETALLVLRG